MKNKIFNVVIVLLVIIALSALVFKVGKKFKKEPETTSVSFKTKIKELKNVKKGTLLTLDYDFKNTGDAPLNLEQVSPDCFCYSVDWDKKPIMPNSSSKIKVKYKVDAIGFHQWTVSVKTNTDPATNILLFRVSVVD